MQGEDDDKAEVMDRLAERFREQRERHEARNRVWEAGEAAPWLYATVDRVAEALPGRITTDDRDSVTHYVREAVSYDNEAAQPSDEQLAEIDARARKGALRMREHRKNPFGVLGTATSFSRVVDSFVNPTKGLDSMLNATKGLDSMLNATKGLDSVLDATRGLDSVLHATRGLDAVVNPTANLGALGVGHVGRDVLGAGLADDALSRAAAGLATSYTEPDWLSGKQPAWLTSEEPERMRPSLLPEVAVESEPVFEATPVELIQPVTRDDVLEQNEILRELLVAVQAEKAAAELRHREAMAAERARHEAAERRHVEHLRMLGLQLPEDDS